MIWNTLYTEFIQAGGRPEILHWDVSTIPAIGSMEYQIESLTCTAANPTDDVVEGFALGRRHTGDLRTHAGIPLGDARSRDWHEMVSPDTGKA